MRTVVELVLVVLMVLVSFIYVLKERKPGTSGSFLSY